jgi:hypothetical protein
MMRLCQQGARVSTSSRQAARPRRVNTDRTTALSEITQCPQLAELRLMRSRIADVDHNVCILDERRTDFDPYA